MICIKEVVNSIFTSKTYILFCEGEDRACLTMVLGDMFFTGDAYFPGVGANTQVPRSNKDQAKQLMERILKLAEGKTILSGHQV